MARTTWSVRRTGNLLEGESVWLGARGERVERGRRKRFKTEAAAAKAGQEAFGDYFGTFPNA